MLEHNFCLVEFKPVFEFIGLNSFENCKTFSFFHSPPFSFWLRPYSTFAAHLLAQPNQLISPRGPARFFSCAAHLRSSRPALPPSFSPASRCQVGPSGHPRPPARPRAAPWLRAGRASAPPPVGPEPRPASSLSLFRSRHPVRLAFPLEP
jgi:hypothetical protein